MTLEKNMIEKLKTTLFSVLLVFLTVMTVSSAFAAERITYIHFDALGSAIAGSDAEGQTVVCSSFLCERVGSLYQN